MRLEDCHQRPPRRLFEEGSFSRRRHHTCSPGLRPWRVGGCYANLSGEELIRCHLVGSALSAPLMRIAQNAGVRRPVVAEHVKGKCPSMRLQRRQPVSTWTMLAAGIVDPAKVNSLGAAETPPSIAGMGAQPPSCIVADMP